MLVYLLYGLSGFISLGYQVAWFRIWVDRFGSTTLTFGLVVCGFVGGLGAGALCSRPFSKALRRIHGFPLLTQWGLLEILVGLAALLTFVGAASPADLWGATTYHEQEGVLVPSTAAWLAQSAITLLCVVLPCFLMGLTYPLLCAGHRGIPRFPSLLYAWNTLGACTGVLVCQFALLPVLGHDNMLALLAAVNVGLGLGVVVLARDCCRLPGNVPCPPPLTSGRDTKRSHRLTPDSFLTCAALAGLVTGAMEGDVVRRIAFLGGQSSSGLAFVSFWAVLAIFLASLLVRTLPQLRLVHIKLAWLASLIWYWGMFRLAYPLQQRLTAWSIGPDINSHEAAFAFPASLTQLLFFVGIFVFPPIFLTALLLPWTCDQLHAAKRHIGRAYGWNTLGFCAGIAGFAWLAPRVSVFYSMKLFVFLLAVATLFLCSLSMRQRTGRLRPVVAVTVLLSGLVAIPAGFDPTYVTPGSPASLYPVRGLRGNGAYTTFVVADPAGERLYFDNHSMSGTGYRAQLYMRLMAHLPLLAHPRPQHALLIGLGVGNTASAIAAHTGIESLDVVELNRSVIDTAPEFSVTNGNVHLDPRIRFWVDDGRSYLRRRSKLYDLITTEPPPPRHAGVHRLYSREFYRDALARLTPEGLMTQWLPTYQLPGDAVAKVIATFLDVFPHCALFTGYGRDFILMGSRGPIRYDLLEDRFDDDPRVREDLQRLRVKRPAALLARLVQDDATLRRNYGNAPFISDQRNDLADLFMRPGQRKPVHYDPMAVLAVLGADRDDLSGLLLHLGRLTYQVPDFPADSLMTVRETPSATAALAGLDWLRLEELLIRYTDARETGRLADAANFLLQGLRLSPEQPSLLLDLGQLFLAVGQHDDALEMLERFRAIEPDDAIGWAASGAALVALGRLDRAMPMLHRALEIEESHAMAHYNLGLSLTARGRLREALHHYERVLDTEPQHVFTHFNLARVHALLGDSRQAILHFRETMKIRPDWPEPAKQLAWILATDADSRLRAPAEAVALADRVLQQVDTRDSELLDILAAAYASAGRFDDAVNTARQALEAAEGTQRLRMIEGIQARLSLYESEHPFRTGFDTYAVAAP